MEQEKTREDMKGNVYKNVLLYNVEWFATKGHNTQNHNEHPFKFDL